MVMCHPMLGWDESIYDTILYFLGAVSQFALSSYMLTKNKKVACVNLAAGILLIVLLIAVWIH